ncbi:MAG: hypothetical protein WBE30_13655 [Candidatus Cybelea sp.]
MRANDGNYEASGTRFDNGAEPPDDLASTLVRTGRGNAEFAIGFDMALEIAAAISQSLATLLTSPAALTGRVSSCGNIAWRQHSERRNYVEGVVSIGLLQVCRDKSQKMRTTVLAP